MTEAQTAEPAGEELAVTVELTITHQVTVRVDATSDQTLEQMKQAALDQYHDVGIDGRSRRGYAADKDDADEVWRRRFRTHQRISVSAQRVAIAGVQTRPVGEGRSWAR